jgi:hypothetical protein
LGELTNAQKAINTVEGYLVDQGNVDALAAAAVTGLAQVYALLAVADEIRVQTRTMAAWMRVLAGAKDPGPVDSRPEDSGARDSGP